MFNRPVKDFVRLTPHEIRNLLSHGASITVDPGVNDAYVHGPEVTAPIEHDLLESMIRDGFVRHVNANDPCVHVAIYQCREAAPA